MEDSSIEMRSKCKYGTTICGFAYKYGKETGFVLAADTLVSYLKETGETGVEKKRIETKISFKKIVDIGANVFLAVSGYLDEATIFITSLRKYVAETESPTYEMVVNHALLVFMRRYEDLRKQNKDVATLNRHCVSFLLASMVKERPQIKCVRGVLDCRTDEDGFITAVSAKCVPCFTCLGSGAYCAMNVFLKFGIDEGIIQLTDNLRPLTKDVDPKNRWDMEAILNVKFQQLEVPFDAVRLLVKKAITKAIRTSEGSGYSVFFLYRNNFGEGYQREYRPIKREPLKKIERRLGKGFFIEPQRYEDERRAQEEDSERRKKREEKKAEKIRKQAKRRPKRRHTRNFLMLPIKSNFLMRVTGQRRARTIMNRRGKENNSRLNGNTKHCDEVDVIISRSSQEKLSRKANTINEPILQNMKRVKTVA